jgi:putative DNA modification/repair radical SAM protein
LDKREKLTLLARAAQYDLCASCGTSSARVRDEIGRWIFPAALPDGKHIALLKVLQSNSCENDCFYCGNRRSRNVSRCDLAPEELAWSFSELVRTGRAEGLFLSSAICHDTARTMAQMIATVELVRKKYEFRGYIHLKLLPGTDDATVERAVALADRVSVNLEAPNAKRLERLSGDKRFEQQLMRPMRSAGVFRDAGIGARAGLTTQFVIGAAGESDAEILGTVAELYHQLRLRRVYYSAFQPVPLTPLQDLAPAPPLREHRLYQSDFLLRQYGFDLADIPLDQSGNLPSEHDPKLGWALRHPERFPIEVNRADREELLRVPGIGPESAKRIILLRATSRPTCLEHLAAIGVVEKRAAPYITINGRRPPQQLPLF